MEDRTQRDRPSAPFRIRAQKRINSSTYKLGQEPPADVWQQLVDVLDDHLVEAVRQLVAGVPHWERERRLREAGIETPGLASVLVALDGPHETVSAREYAQSHPDAVQPAWAALRRHEQAREVVRAIGQAEPSIIGQLDLHVVQELAALLEAAEVEPELDVRLTGEWIDEVRADHRRETLRLLLDLGRGCDLAVIASGYVRAQLLERHRDDLPTRVRQQCTAGGTASPDGIVDVETALEAAHDRLDPDGVQADLLQLLSSSDGEELPYDAIYRANPGRDESTLRGHIGTLLELSLVETRGPDHDKRAALTVVGRLYLDDVDQQPAATGVDDPQNLSDHCRVTRASPGDPPSPADAAAAATAGDRPADWATGQCGVGWLDRRQEAVYREITPDRGVALHDYPVAPQDDPREARWGFDADSDELTVAVDYQNPLQYTVATARALACPRTWDEVLTRRRVDAGGALEGLAISNVGDLMNLSCIGWLDPDEVEDWETLREAMLDALEDLKELTKRWHHEEYDVEPEEFRSTITATAHGLLGSMRMLLWLAGVDVNLVLELPEFRRNFSAGRDDDRREDLLQCLARLSTVGAAYGGQPLHRLLYEEREEKLKWAADPVVDAANPYGQLLGQQLVVGAGVEDLEGDLLEVLERPDPVRDDAPEIGAPIPVRTELPREIYATLVNEALHMKGGLRPSREAVNVLRALLPSPIDAMEALRWLSSEADSRGLRLDEVRYAVGRALQEGTIAERQLLPGAAPAQRAIVATLLEAEDVLAQHELVERAGISAQSFRNHRDELVDVGLLVALEDGWRVALPFSAAEAEAADRGAEDVLDEAVPAFVLEEIATLGDVVWSIVEARLPAERLADPDDPIAGALLDWPPDYGELLDAWPWLAPWLDVLRALVGSPDREPREVLLGLEPSQQPLSAFG